MEQYYLMEIIIRLAGTNVVSCSFYIAPFVIIDDVLLLIGNIGGI